MVKLDGMESGVIEFFKSYESKTLLIITNSSKSDEGLFELNAFIMNYRRKNCLKPNNTVRIDIINMFYILFIFFHSHSFTIISNYLNNINLIYLNEGSQKIHTYQTQKHICVPSLTRNNSQFTLPALNNATPEVQLPLIVHKSIIDFPSARYSIQQCHGLSQRQIQS